MLSIIWLIALIVGLTLPIICGFCARNEKLHAEDYFFSKYISTILLSCCLNLAWGVDYFGSLDDLDQYLHGIVPHLIVLLAFCFVMVCAACISCFLLVGSYECFKKVSD